MIWGRCALLGALLMVSAVAVCDNANADAKSIDALRTDALRALSRDD
jgi:hypothetical protein